MNQLILQLSKTGIGLLLCCQFAALQEVYIGTYTEWGTPPGHGIYHFSISDSGQIGSATLATQGDNKSPNPTYLLKNNDLIYTTNELEVGQITNYQKDIDHSLNKITASNSGLSNPVHLVKSKLYPLIIVANYGNASGEHSGVSVFNINSDGVVDGNPSQIIPYHGSSVDPERQSGSHVHGITSTIIQNNEYVFICDLGADTISVYLITPHTNELQKLSEIHTPPGSGPRHALISPNQEYLYVVNELNSTLSIFRFNAATGSLTYLSSQSTSKLIKHSAERNYPAELLLSKARNDLYVSNRGVNTIAQFHLQNHGKTLQLEKEYNAFGKYPRDMAIDQTGQYLASANQLSNNVSVFKINPSGGLDFLNHVDIDSPVAVTF